MCFSLSTDIISCLLLCKCTTPFFFYPPPPPIYFLTNHFAPAFFKLPYFILLRASKRETQGFLHCSTHLLFKMVALLLANLNTKRFTQTSFEHENERSR